MRGKGTSFLLLNYIIQDHPRLCGEKSVMQSAGRLKVGSPPPMRGKDHTCDEATKHVRITPAYAGKSDPQTRSSTRSRDHPRLCGEKRKRWVSRQLAAGSPPPMRGKAMNCRNCSYTCQDHPRLCGEKDLRITAYKPDSGSPPPMRGKAGDPEISSGVGGITPAYAGKSHAAGCWLCRQWDHPRLCGEKLWRSWTHCRRSGSPPPMRGKEPSDVSKKLDDRITPAYAGKSTAFCSASSRRWDHPRLCGEKIPRLRHNLSS